MEVWQRRNDCLMDYNLKSGVYINGIKESSRDLTIVIQSTRLIFDI